MKKSILLISFAFLAFSCQKPPTGFVPEENAGEACRIMFWNAENLFDCRNDSLTQDEEFLPNGVRSWTLARYKQKINNMYKVFIAAGDWNPPDLIGLCEIENKSVLYDLVKNSPFSYYNYRFIHYDSPDRRGIDVALLYNPSTIVVLSDTAITVSLSAETSSVTRDILFARVKIITGDTLSVFINHWPSKYGGAGITEDLRESVANTLSKNINKLLDKNPYEKIIIMGDFNDPPESSSLAILANKKYPTASNESQTLVNLAKDYTDPIPGSYKFDGTWQLIDQILVSNNLVTNRGATCLKPNSFRVFAPPFLLERDEKYGGSKPFRTYTGFIYHGGFSDHLPIILDLFAGQ